ncbi:FkbM family methyltransferase [Phenylobacterium sp. LjRoot225]|uniref:FkbM family methyltransferase n=1 Tax=Phenylobacterium sp. LjRoot225 TaxID=3342285 RepID=UPI003ED11B3B
MQAVLDVGANDGSWGLNIAQQNPHIKVYGFEPTPRMCEIIRGKVSELSIANYELIPVAVSDYEGVVKFNVAGQADWGCSSLLTFSDDLDQTWPGRTDFKVTETIDVQCITLEKFVKERGISDIEFLHTDVQGVDLKVMASLGDSIQMVKRGMLETASSKSVALYKGQHTIEDVVMFLLRNGFEIERMTPNDVHCNEVNVLYKKIWA